MIQLENVVKSIPDDRDYLYIPNSQALPSAIDLKPGVYEVDDQKSLGSCTSNATTSACEYILKQAGQPISLSRLFTYYDTRNNVEDRAGQEGASTRDAVRSLYHSGTCPESTWPYTIGNENIKPSEAAYAAVGPCKAGRYEAVNVSMSYVDRSPIIHAVKSCIADGIPVIISMYVGNQIRTLTGDWHTHKMESVNSINNPMLGAHAVLVIGFDDASGKFLIENSWGKDWGDGGFFGLDYNVFGSDVFEAFIIREFAGYSLCNVFHVAKETKPLVINVVPNPIESWEAEASVASNWTTPIVTQCEGGTAPFDIQWKSDVVGMRYLPEGVQLAHVWGAETEYSCQATVNVADSSYPVQSYTSAAVAASFYRGKTKPINVDPIIVPPVESTKEDKNDYPIGAVIGVIGFIIAIAYYVMM